ncbi:hypothetical protein BGZ94_000235 [Podila epigama]|nr:hypothetical protein BGZ94_000235 [Podila epigama]
MCETFTDGRHRFICIASNAKETDPNTNDAKETDEKEKNEADVIYFKIVPSSGVEFGEYKGAIIRDINGASTVYAQLQLSKFKQLEYCMSEGFPRKHLVPRNSVVALEIILTNKPSSRTQPVDPGYYCESLMEKLLNDTKSHNVHFTFMVNSSSQGDHEGSYPYESEMRACPLKAVEEEAEKAEQMEENDKEEEEEEEGSFYEDNIEGSTSIGPTDSHDEGDSNGEENYSDVDDKVPDLHTVTSKQKFVECNELPSIKDRQPSETLSTIVVGAHSSVLSQHRFFQRPEFQEKLEAASSKEPWVVTAATLTAMKDISVFRLVLQFMYLGQILPQSSPIFVSCDSLPSLEHRGVPTWEMPLRYQILAGLNAAWAIPFLSRTAYKFPALRSGVIKFIVQNNMNQIAQKGLQTTYFNHSECSALFGEIMSELWRVHVSKTSLGPVRI